MLEYIYGSTPILSKAVIDAADKYGMESLKLTAEKSYVDAIQNANKNGSGISQKEYLRLLHECSDSDRKSRCCFA